MDKTWSDLPDECWESIADKLGTLLESLSLVSKTLLSITNQCRSSLRVRNPSIQILASSLKRFPFLNKLDLSYFRGDLSEALVKISESNLNLKELNISHISQKLSSFPLTEIGQKMKNIKVFKSSHSYFSDTDLFILAEFFTSIEELDISRQQIQNITDKGVVALSVKLDSLRILNLTGNAMISDQSLISLSVNCVKLTEIAVGNCIHLSQTGISSVIRNCPDFSSLILASDMQSNLTLTIPFIHFSKHLRKIEFSHMKISNKILYDIVRANLPLKQFSLSYCRNFTLDGLSSFLKSYKFLESLALDGIDFITDDFLVLISEFIGYLTFISLEFCHKLTVSSFVTIASACPSITTVNIRITSSSSNSEVKNDSVIKNPSIKSCSIQCRTTLDGLLQVLLQICPNLQTLNVTSLAADSAELDISEILHSCRALKHLTVGLNAKLRFSQGIPCNLESLSMKKSDVNEQVLEMVSMRCPELVNLDMEGSVNVTERGVKMVVQNCRKLRYLNMDLCSKLNEEVMEWIMMMMDTSSSLSLREIVIPCFYDVNRVDQSHCLLRTGSLSPFLAFSLYISSPF